jgi:uncharacterized protein (TIGR02231 family)
MAEAFSYTEVSLGKVATEQQSIDVQPEELQAKQTALEKQLNELRGARGRQSKTVTVRISLTTPGRLEVALRYSIPNAGWSPAYTARLRSTDRAIDLSYFGVIQNGTGEDWNNIALTLSTARPSLGGGAPELQPWIADIVRSRSGTASSFSNSTVVSPDMVGQVRDLPLVGSDVLSLIETRSGNSSVRMARPAESEAGLMAADVDANITSATFKIPVSVSVAGNNVSQKVAIKDARLAATLQFQSTPRILEAAFLSASTSNTTDYPLLAGPMNTYLDDTFVAVSNLKTIMPGEKFELALGADEGIAVKRRLVNRFAEETGLTNKTHRITYEFLISLTNNETTTERIVFKEPTPQPRDERIVVKLLSPQEKEIGTSNSPKEIMREENGRIAWRVIQAGREARVHSRASNIRMTSRSVDHLGANPRPKERDLPKSLPNLGRPQCIPAIDGFEFLALNTRNSPALPVSTAVRNGKSVQKRSETREPCGALSSKSDLWTAPCRNTSGAVHGARRLERSPVGCRPRHRFLRHLRHDARYNLLRGSDQKRRSGTESCPHAKNPLNIRKPAVAPLKIRLAMCRVRSIFDHRRWDFRHDIPAAIRFLGCVYTTAFRRFSSSSMGVNIE